MCCSSPKSSQNGCMVSAPRAPKKRKGLERHGCVWSVSLTTGLTFVFALPKFFAISNATTSIECCANEKLTAIQTMRLVPSLRLGVFQNHHQSRLWRVAVSEIWDVRVYKPPFLFAQAFHSYRILVWISKIRLHQIHDCSSLLSLKWICALDMVFLTTFLPFKKRP
jgi:hypothetical protein